MGGGLGGLRGGAWGGEGKGKGVVVNVRARGGVPPPRAGVERRTGGRAAGERLRPGVPR